MCALAAAPTISVFISNYNHAHYLERALNSLCFQEVLPDEVVVADDFSTDNSLEILERYAARFPFLRYFRYPAKSSNHIKEGMQQLLQLKGDYILWFASDDWLYPGYFRAIKQTAMRFPGIGVICSCFHHMGPNEIPFRNFTYGVQEVCSLQGTELHKYLCLPGIGVSGVGTVARNDAYRWLLQHGCGELGQWVEMGLTVAAVKWGLAIVPEFLAAYNDFGPSYHMDNMYHETRCLEWFQKLRSFLRQTAFQSLLPPSVIDALERIAYGTFPPQTKLRLELNRWMSEAQEHMKKGQIDQAGQIAQALVNQHPHYLPGWELAGVICFQLGRFDDAEQVFVRGLQLNPQHANLHNNLGMVRSKQGRLDEALVSLQEAARLHPEFAEAHQNLGDTLASLGRVSEASDMYSRALQIDPGLVSARMRLDQLQSSPPHIVVQGNG